MARLQSNWCVTRAFNWFNDKGGGGQGLFCNLPRWTSCSPSHRWMPSNSQKNSKEYMVFANAGSASRQHLAHWVNVCSLLTLCQQNKQKLIYWSLDRLGFPALWSPNFLNASPALDRCSWAIADKQETKTQCWFNARSTSKKSHQFGLTMFRVCYRLSPLCLDSV